MVLALPASSQPRCEPCEHRAHTVTSVRASRMANYKEPSTNSTSPMRSEIWVRSIRWSSGGCRNGHNRRQRIAKRQCGRRHDVGWWGGLTLPSQDVEHEISGMDRCDRALQHRRPQLPAVRRSAPLSSARKLPPHTFDRGRQHPVLERSAVAQSAGFASTRVAAACC